MSWVCAVLIGGAALLSLSACSDSTDVGLGVGPGSDSLEGGKPVTVDVLPDLDTTRTPPITGENFRRASSRSTWRVLTGIVDDPIPGTGTIETEGYVDFAGRRTLPSQIISADNADSLAAELRLTTNYLHGASGEPMEVKVYNLTAEAEMDSARANAGFDADETDPASVTTAQIIPTDSLVTIELRQSWIDEHLTTLQDTSDGGSGFEDNFSGFKIIAPNSEAVVGFSAANAALRLTHTPDSVTADYPALKTFTHIEQRNVTASPSDDYELMVGGIGVGLTMNWNFDENPLDSLATAPLNRAEIFVPADTLAMADFPGSNFVRPLPNGYRVIATRTSDASPCTAVRLPVFSRTNEACVLPLLPSAPRGVALVSDNVAFPIFQQSFQRVRNGRSPLFRTYRVRVADRDSASVDQASTIQPGLPSTLPVLIQRPSSTQGEVAPPRATLTVTPL
jgi:hypothetical protein